ncbi:hypothetical protein FRB90_001449 [Tulasnella sp. 427]|nr:hypothetical protein FRB90_001449 [Tulasnella sp. 427]
MASISNKRKRNDLSDEDDSYVLPQRGNFATFKEWIGMIILDCLERVQQATRDAKVIQMKKFHKKWEDAIAVNSTKSTKTTVSALQDLEEKMTLIKEVDLNQLAFSGLYKRLIKDDILASDKQVAEAIEEEIPPSKRERRHVPSKEEVDVNSLLMRTQVLVNELKASVMRLQAAIGMEGSRPTGSQRPTAKTPYPQKAVVAKEEEWGGIQSSGCDQVSDDEDNSEDGSGDFAVGVDEYSEEVDDDGWESGSVDSSGQVIQGVAGSEDSDSDASNVIRMDLSDLSDDEDQRGSISEEELPSTKMANKASSVGKKVKGKPGSGGNLFLPSLSVGFLPGDDDPTDDWKNFDVDGPPPKKNRPGQRARRALAERKYGNRANHLKDKVKDANGTLTTAMTDKERRKAERQANRENKKRQEWEERKRALKSMIKTHSVKQDDFFVGGKATQQNARIPFVAANKLKSGKAKSVDDKPLHPSWQAKQRLKQKEALGGNRPQGKKIVFS